MIIEKKSFSANNPLPDGLHPVVISGLHDLGIVKSKFGDKDKFLYRFTDAQGRESAKFYGKSVHPKSNLSKDVTTLKGDVPSKFDPASLIGTQCQALVETYKGSDGSTKSIVSKVLKPQPNQNVPLPGAAVQNEASREAEVFA